MSDQDKNPPSPELPPELAKRAVGVHQAGEYFLVAMTRFARSNPAICLQDQVRGVGMALGTLGQDILPEFIEGLEAGKEARHNYLIQHKKEEG